MGEALLLGLWIGTILILGYKMEHDKNARESHEWWLSDVKSCLRNIECEFRQNCEKIIEEELARRNFDECRYRERIGELREKYLREMTEKAISLKRARITTIPNHLATEYEKNISDIADTFRYFGSLMSEQKQRKEHHIGIS